MTLLARDTNGYVEIVQAGVGFVVLMPVIAELLQGARTVKAVASLRQHFVEPVPECRRVAAMSVE